MGLVCAECVCYVTMNEDGFKLRKDIKLASDLSGHLSLPIPLLFIPFLYNSARSHLLGVHVCRGSGEECSEYKWVEKEAPVAVGQLEPGHQGPRRREVHPGGREPEWGKPSTKCQGSSGVRRTSVPGGEL